MSNQTNSSSAIYSEGVRMNRCPKCQKILVVRPGPENTWTIPHHPPDPVHGNKRVRHCEGSGLPEGFLSGHYR